jgi:hypothetical protein
MHGQGRMCEPNLLLGAVNSLSMHHDTEVQVGVTDNSAKRAYSEGEVSHAGYSVVADAILIHDAVGHVSYHNTLRWRDDNWRRTAVIHDQLASAGDVLVQHARVGRQRAIQVPVFPVGRIPAFFQVPLDGLF